MFLFRADTYLKELARFAPEMLKACQQSFDESKQDSDFLRLANDSFTACPSDSVDYAVMEHTESAVVIPLSAQWNDVGAWSALWEVSEQVV